jgi:hypothetical protein
VCDHIVDGCRGMGDSTVIVWAGDHAL